MPQQNMTPVAIVGMSCRLPGKVSTPADFYRMMCRKRSAWSAISKERFNAEAYHHPNPDKKGCFNSQGGYFLQDDISMFDAAFFDITKKEAESMDPAQRLLLECAYEALENAGMPKETVSGRRMGVFVGGNYSEHRVSNLRDLDHIPSFDATGNQAAFLAGRLAYYFNLRGPAFTIDTACSSSMHALHLAVQSIRTGESELAIVGASHLITDPDVWVSMSKLRLFSQAGKTYAFDHRAKSGYARGEGAGCLVLKPLTQAQVDNDHIFSVITHSGISHNGRTIGIVAPNRKEQERLLRKVFAEAEINPCDVGFFEAHGTGTKKGDPIEAEAIHQAVGRHFSPENPLYIGSVKANIGHLECASGVVSVIKAVLMLYYGFILPNADFERANEAIPLDEWNMRVATEQEPWPARQKYVCVNNFGFSGSNATCVLSAAPRLRDLEIASNSAYRPLRLFVVTANDEIALRNSIKRLGIWIEQHAELYQTTMPRNLAYTLCQRRSHLPWRVAVVASMCSDVASALNSHEAVPARAPSEPPRLAFVYTGQGAQWYAMGRELMFSHPTFFRTIFRAYWALHNISGLDLFRELLTVESESRVGLAHISQPVCTAVQLALTDLLATFGVRPAAVTGHSSGEIAAAYAIGVLTVETAMQAAYYRGQAIRRLKRYYPNLKGAMMAVDASAEELGPVLERLRAINGPRCVVACENSPSSTTLSGDEDAINYLETALQERGTFARKLFVDVAYHSPHMKRIDDWYYNSVRHIEGEASAADSPIAFFSSLRGRRIHPTELGPEYWVDNLTDRVRFSTALQCLLTEDRPDILIEIGPHAALKGPIMQGLRQLPDSVATKITYLPTLVRGRNATQTCLETVGQLFVRGYTPDFCQVNHRREENERPELIPSLYTYPWSRQKYCSESRLARQHRLKPFARNDLLGTLADWSNNLEPTWRNIIRIEDLPWLKEYRVQSRMVFPVACFISMVVEAAAQDASLNGLPAAKFEIHHLQVSEHLFLADNQEFEILVSFHPSKGGEAGCHVFRIISYEATRGWLNHCTGTVVALPGETPLDQASPHSASVLPTPASSDDGNRLLNPDNFCHWGPEKIYGDLASRRGMSYPSSFRALEELYAGEEFATSQCSVPKTHLSMPLQHETPYKLHPSIIDAVFQLLLLLRMPHEEGDEVVERPHLPLTIDRITLQPFSGDRFTVRAIPERGTPYSAVDIPLLWDPSANAAVCMTGVEFLALETAPQAPPAPRELCFTLTWVPLEEVSLNKVPLEEGESSGMRNPRMEWAGPEFVIVAEPRNGVMAACAVHLSREIRRRTGTHAAVLGMRRICEGDYQKHYFIVLDDLMGPIMEGDDCEAGMERVKSLLTKAPGVMWVTEGAVRFPTSPHSGMAIGLCRTARSERDAAISTFDLDPRSSLDDEARAALMWKAFAASVLADREDAEMEIAEEDGNIVVARIMSDGELNTKVQRAIGPSGPGSIFRPEGTHLIIGAGGLGRSIAKYMIAHGARSIAMVVRSPRSNDAVCDLFQEMRAMGYDFRLLVFTYDIADLNQAKQLLEHVERDMPRICGVVHAAMVLRDVLIENMSHEDFMDVVRPKVEGAYNLITAGTVECTRDAFELDYFVMLSSAAGIIGSRGQGAYATANAWLDSFALFLANSRIPATALDLTAVTGAGYMAENTERREDILRNFGNETISEDEVLALLSVAVRGQCAPQCMTGLRLHLNSDGQLPYYANERRFAWLKIDCLDAAKQRGLVPREEVSTGHAFRAAKSDNEAARIAARGLVEKLSEILSLAAQDVDVARNITSYGLDSLTAIELRNWIAKELRANLQILELLSSGTISDLAALIVQKTREV